MSQIHVTISEDVFGESERKFNNEAFWIQWKIPSEIIFGNRNASTKLRWIWVIIVPTVERCKNQEILRLE